MARLIRTVADVMEIVREPRAPTPGNVKSPVSDGFTVDGGWRRRYGPSADGRVLVCILSAIGLGVGAVVTAAARRPTRSVQSGSKTARPGRVSSHA